MDGFYNEHLVRDVGALNLALFVLTAGALILATMALARLTALAWIAYALPHFVYHLRHLSMPMAGSEKVALVASLAVTVIAPLIVLTARPRTHDLSPRGGIASPGEARPVHLSRA
jgi:lysylphosphatidylglycerol synthetase-like protein (DUF2156 family)